MRARPGWGTVLNTRVVIKPHGNSLRVRCQSLRTSLAIARFITVLNDVDRVLSSSSRCQVLCICPGTRGQILASISPQQPPFPHHSYTPMAPGQRVKFYTRRGRLGELLQTLRRTLLST
ncbi:hypothetical protein PHLCEN_2v1949 [Hermanssonia centrifuga]|uniref:Uncharacterized protein n=1 Tax=Hermanssonia centrifuga TaxID=98765 RepID=A0A2R6RVJ9_9APHY|nr:hypothetical protein PHLCEN_2v1949 [Hermanssonia centrifuga]